MNLEQITPISEETGISVDPTVSDMDLSGISVTIDDSLDQDQAGILSVAKMFIKKAVSIGHSHAIKSDFHVTRSVHFTLIIQ